MIFCAWFLSLSIMFSRFIYVVIWTSSFYGHVPFHCAFVHSSWMMDTGSYEYFCTIFCVHIYAFISLEYLCRDRIAESGSDVSQLCPTLCDPTDCSPPGSSVHGDSPGKDTGVGCHFLLQGIFPTHMQADSLPSEPPGNCGVRCYVCLTFLRTIKLFSQNFY